MVVTVVLNINAIDLSLGVTPFSTDTVFIRLQFSPISSLRCALKKQIYRLQALNYAFLVHRFRSLRDHFAHSGSESQINLDLIFIWMCRVSLNLGKSTIV